MSISVSFAKPSGSSGQRSVLFDTETTGLDPRAGHRVIEIAALELINDLPTERKFHHLIHPERDIPEDASRIHGMTLEHLRDKPLFRAIAEELIDFLGPDEMLVAHNAPFDFGFLNAEFERHGHPPLPLTRMVDTLAMAKTRFPGMPNSLDALCRRFGIDLSERTAHNALLDCKLLAEVYIELTGGRQRGLSLAASEETFTIATYEARPDRTIRHIGVSEEEQARHAKFLERVKNPIWLASAAP
jgi:DNA polymerase-3 subunit epsilon